MRSVPLIPAMILSASLALLAGCSEVSSEKEAPGTESVTEAAGQAPPPSAASADMARGEEAPGFTTSAAPGVAFAYSYAFTLPGKAISDVQHRHAAACEELGAQRCQVTGMDFR